MGKTRQESYYNRADAETEKETFIKIVKQYHGGNSDSISVADAIGLIKQWNYWIVYGKTLALVKAEFEKIDAIEAIARQNELMGLSEGAILSPTAKTYITNVTYLDVEKQKLVSGATIGITGNTITSITTKSRSTLPPMLPSLMAEEIFISRIYRCSYPFFSKWRIIYKAGGT